MRTLCATAAVFLLCGVAMTQTTRPTTRPVAPNPDDMLKQLLAPSRATLQPIEPLPDEKRVDPNTIMKPVAPAAPTLNLLREGTYVFDRVGRLSRSPDGQMEFVFESDGQALKDPPMIVLPNLRLGVMESAIKNASSRRELRFQISGMVTEYGSRNYILIEKALVMPEEK